MLTSPWLNLQPYAVLLTYYGRTSGARRLGVDDILVYVDMGGVIGDAVTQAHHHVASLDKTSWEIVTVGIDLSTEYPSASVVSVSVVAAPQGPLSVSRVGVATGGGEQVLLMIVGGGRRITRYEFGLRVVLDDGRIVVLSCPVNVGR